MRWADTTSAFFAAATCPAPKIQSPSFMIKLLGAWIARGFRSPKIEVGGELHV